MRAKAFSTRLMRACSDIATRARSTTPQRAVAARGIVIVSILFSFQLVLPLMLIRCARLDALHS